MTNPLFRFIDWSGRTWWMMAWVVAACLLIGGWGFYAYYGPQFAWIGLEHWHVYPFVPDCPLFVYLFAAVILLRYAGLGHPAFTALVALGNIKYGIWTVFVLLYYFEAFFGGGETGLRSAILLLHVGMVPLGILLWRTLPRLPAWQYGAVLGALLLYDYVDYFFTRAYQVYPIGLPSHPDHVPYSWQEFGLVPWFTIFESLILVGWLYLSQTHFEARAPQAVEATPQPEERP